MPSPKKVDPALWTDRITAAAAAVISVVAVADLIRYIALGELIPVVTVLVLNCFFVLAAAAAWQGRMPYLLLFVTAGGIVVFVNTTYAAYAPFNLGFLIQAIAAGLAAVIGTGLCIWKKLAPRALPWKPAAAALLVLALFLGTWKGFTDTAKAAQGDARREIWAVPTQFDGQPSSQPGTVEELVYETKAYATDERFVAKRALVYLPYGYDESIQYNILYLMHGTGDDENYWLSTHESNKVMLDNMIAAGVIEPLIVVTPTFYVEEDCADDLDQLTWSFRSELRQDAGGGGKVLHLCGDHRRCRICCQPGSPGLCRPVSGRCNHAALRLLRQSGLLRLVRHLQRQPHVPGGVPPGHPV